MPGQSDGIKGINEGAFGPYMRTQLHTPPHRLHAWMLGLSLLSNVEMKAVWRGRHRHASTREHACFFTRLDTCGSKGIVCGEIRGFVSNPAV